MTKKSKRKKKAKQDDSIGFKLIKPVPQDSLLPDYERLKNLNLPAALKATYLTKTIENQSDNELFEGDQYQNDTSVKTILVSKRDQYQNDTSVKTTLEKKQPEPIKIKEIPDTVNERLKFKPGFFSQWEASIFNELRKILSNSEFKIYTVLFENSWAFGKNITGIIGYQTIAEKTGLSKRTVIRNIEKLIKRKIIEKRNSFNNLGTVYKVNLPENAEIQPNEIENRGKSQFAQDNDESTFAQTQSSPAQSTPPLLDVPDEEKFIFENNLIKVKTQEEIIKTLKSKPFSLKDDIIQQIIKTTSP
jgi:DNA-binding Lrp family transcriptional regulator